MAEVLAGAQLQLKDGSKVDAGQYLKNKFVGLYFSASWCPPCRAFTPKLKEFYEKIKKSHPEFEVIFVSRDRNAEDLFKYYDEHMGDWAFIPFGDEKIQELLVKYEVKTIPSMKMIKEDGTIVVADARTEVQTQGLEDPEGLYEAWEAFNM
ncbi:unnamed protein product [Auanema sp. JU1783]|nr:unnamed protein product [Auanema sp. JU1783]